MLRISSNRIQDNIHSTQQLLESLFLIVHDFLGAEASDVGQISGRGGCDYMKAGLAGPLYRVNTDVSRPALDEHGLPRRRPSLIEKHLPRSDTYNWSGSRLDEVQALWFLCHPSG